MDSRVNAPGRTPADDRAAIVDALHAYAWAIDTRAWDLLATDVFAPGVVADYGRPEPIRSSAEMVEFMISSHEHVDATQHLIGNCSVVLAGDTATSRCYVHASLVRRHTRGGDRVVIGARYADELAHGPTGWRITHRTATLMFRDGNPAILRPPP